MGEVDPCADAPLVDWSELGVSGLLPTGTVTLLLGDVEGSTRLWETQPEVMTAAIARLNQVVSDVIAAHNGVRPVEQGEGDSFVAAFARASDAVAAALQLQLSPLAPIRLRIGVHTGEVQLRDEGNYAGPTVNRTARLRDLGHGAQTVLSGATAELVADRLPASAWLTELGTHPLRDLPRPERVVQLCHPHLQTNFPPLRTPKSLGAHNLPVQLTSFVGREAELKQVRELLAENRLVTLTGAGGVGKTRLAVQVAAQLAGEFGDGTWYVDLAPITDPDVQAQQALAIARELDDPALLARALTACGFIAGENYDVEVARAYFAEAIGLARALDDRWRLSQILALQALSARTAGDPLGVRATAEEGRDLADAIGARFNSRQCRFCLGWAQMMQGDLAGAVAQLGAVAAEAGAAHDEIWRVLSLGSQSLALACQGQVEAARAAADATLEGGAELGGRFAASGHMLLGFTALAAGDGAAAHEARQAARLDPSEFTGVTAALQRFWNAEGALADGDLAAARDWADEAVSTTTGWFLVWALTMRARVAIAGGDPKQAERDARDALVLGAEIKVYLLIPDILECLAVLAGEADGPREAVRLFGAAQAIRQRIGAVRFKMYDVGYEASVAALRDAIGAKDFEWAWAEGAALSIEEAAAYA